MRKHFSLLAAGLLLSVGLLSSTADAADKVIRIPFLTNFTGPSAPFSLRVWGGAEIAMNEINASGGVRGGHKLELYKVDNRSETQTALTEYRRACADESVPMLMAAVSSKDVIAMYEVAKGCNMATFATTSGSHWVFPDQGKWMYRYLPVPALVLPVLYERLQSELGVKRVALAVEIDNDFAVNNAKRAREYLKDLGIEIVLEVDSKMHETNFAAQVSAIRAAKPDLVLLSHNSDAGGRFMRQLRERGVDTPVSDTGYTIAGRDFWKNSEGKGAGAISSSIYTSSDNRPIVQDWISLWRKTNDNSDKVPGAYETASYDSIQVLAKVLESAKSLSREDIAQAFLDVQDLETISGTVSFRSQDLPDVYRSEPILIRLGENGELNRWGARIN
jgi:branched-chain amino acid transport system substrate-binding protein